MMVRCGENTINTYDFLKLQNFEFSDILGVRGTAEDFISAAFWMPGATFSGSDRVLGI